MKLLTYTKILLLSMLVLGLSACDDEDNTEYWLPGNWTGTVGNRDASFLFNENRTGSFRIQGGDSGTFDWYFEDEKYWDAPSGTIVLDFGHGDKACITGSYADRVSISGWYFAYYDDYLDGYDDSKRALVLRRVGY